MACSRVTFTLTYNADYEQIYFSLSNPILPSVSFSSSIRSYYPCVHFLPLLPSRLFRISANCSYPPCSSSVVPGLSTSLSLSNFFSAFYYFVSSAPFLLPCSSPVLILLHIFSHATLFLSFPHFYCTMFSLPLFQFCTPLLLYFTFL